MEPNGHALMGDQEHVLFAIGAADGDQLVSFFQVQRTDTGLSGSVQAGQGDALDGAKSGGKDQELIIGKFPNGNHGRDLFPLLHRQDVD